VEWETSKAYGYLFRCALAHAGNITDGSHASTTLSNGWQYLLLPIAQRRLAKMMVIRLSCCPKYLHPKIRILTWTQNLGGLLRRHRGRNRRRVVAGNTSQVCRSACASNTWTPSSAAEQSEGFSGQNPTRGGVSASQIRNSIMQSTKSFVSPQGWRKQRDLWEGFGRKYPWKRKRHSPTV
jgi:hypothetical protein